MSLKVHVAVSILRVKGHYFEIRASNVMLNIIL